MKVVIQAKFKLIQAKFKLHSLTEFRLNSSSHLKIASLKYRKIRKAQDGLWSGS